MTISGADLELTQALIALTLLGLSLVCMPLAYWSAWGATHRAHRPWLIGATLAGASLRWLVAPPLLAMIFIGYKQTEHALTLLPLSHYGVGATALYHTLFGLLPSPDHRTMIAINAVIGVLSLPLLAPLSARLLRDPRAGLLSAWLVALTPLFIRNDLSEANIVPTLWWTLGGMVLVDSWALSGRRLRLVAALPLLALAAMARPEMPLMLAILLPLSGIAAGWFEQGRMRAWPLWLSAAALIALVIPHLMHTLNAMRVLEGRASLPGLGLDEVTRLPQMLFWERNITLRPDLFPAGISACALIGLMLGKGHRRGLVALWIATLFALALYVVDLDEANIARVQVPGALLITLLGAAGLSRLWGLDARRRLLGPLVLVLVLLSALPSVFTLWAPANEHTEETLIQEASAGLDADIPFTLIRLGERDRRGPGQDSQFTHYHFPDYLFRPPTREGVVRAVGDFLEDPSFETPALFFHGMRCYAEFRSPGLAAPEGDDLHPACAAMHQRFELEALIEREVDNHGDVWIRYYGTAETLRVGLYRVRGRK